VEADPAVRWRCAVSQHRPVGTTISCRAGAVDAGRYRVTITIEDSSVAHTSTETLAVAGLPSLLSYRSTQSVILKDGQSIEYATATDPTSGDVVKADVELTVLK
jgi:hypothetical protein